MSANYQVNVVSESMFRVKVIKERFLRNFYHQEKII